MFTQIAAALAALALLSSSADGALMPNVLLMCADVANQDCAARPFTTKGLDPTKGAPLGCALECLFRSRFREERIMVERAVRSITLTCYKAPPMRTAGRRTFDAAVTKLTADVKARLKTEGREEIYGPCPGGLNEYGERFLTREGKAWADLEALFVKNNLL